MKYFGSSNGQEAFHRSTTRNGSYFCSSHFNFTAQTNRCNYMPYHTPFSSAQSRDSSLQATDDAGSSTPMASHIKLLGITLNSRLSIAKHTKLVSQPCFYHIRALHHIRSVLDRTIAVDIAFALVSSTLNYAKSHCFFLQSKHAVNSTGSANKFSFF